LSEQETVFWGIHGGKTGDADTLFRKQRTIGLGWPEMGDLQALAQTREAYKTRLGLARPDIKTGAIPVAAGQMYRFVNEMKLGDHVIYRSKVSQQFHIGIVRGDYKYNPKVNSAYPHQRELEWVKEMSPTTMTQGALYEMGSAMSFFKVRNYADEWQAGLSSSAGTKKIVKPIDPHEDDSVVMVAESISQNTRDFILKQFQAELKGHPFAEFVGHLLTRMGYVARVSPAGTDGGVDIIAHKDELGFEPPIIKVQVKSSDGNVGHPDVAYLIGTLAPQGEFGLVVSLSDFTTQAKSFAKGKANLRLLNANDVIDLTLTHYEALDPKYKAIIPLKQVFVPEPIDD
jgi:restriction system protein